MLQRQKSATTQRWRFAVIGAAVLAVAAIVLLVTAATRSASDPSSEATEASVVTTDQGLDVTAAVGAADPGATQAETSGGNPSPSPNDVAGTAPAAPPAAASVTTDSATPVLETTGAAPAPAPAEPPAAPAPEPVAAPAPPAADSLITGRQMYATGSVNVRDAPGTDGTTVIDGLGTNQQVTAGDTVDGWVPVHAGDTYGWVSAQYLADGAPVAAPAEPAAAPQAAPESSGNWMEALIPQVDPGGAANWVLERNGALGATDGHTIYIDPNVPSDKRFSVMVHEYSHILEVQVYGSLNASAAALSAIIGASSSDVTANESTADCMALMLGASWVDYGCQPALQDAAAAILSGQRP